MDWMFVSLRISYVEALTSGVAIFGERVSKEVIKVKWGYPGKGQFDRVSVLRRREISGHCKKVAVYKPGTELSPESEFAGNLIMVV